jgi:putative restriction endonuclease
LILEAKKRPEMHWNGTQSLNVEEENILRFPLNPYTIEYINEVNALDMEDEATLSSFKEFDSLATTDNDSIVLTTTEKEQVIKTRIGQTIFKKKLLDVEIKCSLCGINEERFLIASHIKPWRQANNYERLDVNNGLLLCPNHDSLFDKGYISFGDDGVILISNNLGEDLRLFLNISGSMKIFMNERKRQYIKWHREILYFE